MTAALFSLSLAWVASYVPVWLWMLAKRDEIETKLERDTGVTPGPGHFLFVAAVFFAFAPLVALALLCKRLRG